MAVVLWVSIAGGLHVEVDGPQVADAALGGRQGRKVLGRMAWERRSVHRDELADGIWIGTLPRTLERTLSGVITRLRTGLATAGAPSDLISFVDGRYSIDSSVITVDVHQASTYLARGRDALDAGDARAAIALASSGLMVARRPLMPGDDGSWLDLARARHRALLRDLLDVLADASLADGRFAEAESAARESIHWEPVREVGHQRLVRILAESGDRAAAIEAYAQCRRVLADELGVTPSPDTEGLRAELLGDVVVTDTPRHQDAAAGRA